jgi:hypothetical protein
LFDCGFFEYKDFKKGKEKERAPKKEKKVECCGEML